MGRTLNKGRSAFTSASDMLANVGGVAATFFLAPLLFHASVSDAQVFALSNYGHGWDWLVSILWALGCGLITFAGSKMLLAVTFRLGSARLTALIFGRDQY
ncbi:MAG: hypothetical protein AAFX04_13165 [Pseudomonadota bacterium]